MSAEVGRWVRLYVDDTLVGLGFHLSRTYLVTAAHCVETVAVGAVIETRDEGGRSQSATFVEATGDVALLLASSPQANRIRPLRAAVPSAGDRWVGEARRSEQYAILTGSVAGVNIAYELSYGPATVHQLTIDEQLGDHRGYSGGPVCTPSTDDESSVLGLLVEQYPDAVDAQRASNVLFAIPIHSVLTQLSAFDGLYSPVQHDQADGLPKSGSPIRTATADNDSISAVLTEADQILRQAKQWTLDQIIPADEFEIYRVRVSRALLDGLEKK